MSEEKGGFLQKLSKPFKNSSDSKEESHDVVIQDAYLEGKKKVESEHNGPSAVIQHAYLEGKKRAESEHRGTSAHSATSSTATTGGHTVSRDAEGSISSSDSNIITSTSTGKLLSSPPRVQRKPIDKQLAGDFTNHKKPIEKDVIAGNQTATKNTSKKSDLVENSNPAYTDESTVREGSGYYFNPKDTQAGVYNNKDAGDYSEATQAKIDKNHKLKTEPTAYTIEREAYEAGKEKFHKEQASAKSSHASHGKSVGAAAAGAGATAAAVGAHNHKNAASTSNNTYDSELNKVNAQIDANQKKINALGTNSDVDAASTTAVYEEPYASHKATTKSNENDGATYLGVVGGRKNAPSSTTSSSNSKQIKKDAYNQGVHNSAYNQGTDAAIEDSTSKSRRYDTGATTSSPSTTANKSHGTTASVAGVFGGLGATAATGAAVESKTHSSHSTPTTADHDSILKESYAAGQSKAKSEHHSTRSTGEAIPGVSGSGPTVYGETSLPSSTVRDSSTSSNSPGVFAGVAGALGATAAALGLSSANTPTDPHSTSSVPTTTSSTKDPTTATTTSSKDIVTPKNPLLPMILHHLPKSYQPIKHLPLTKIYLPRKLLLSLQLVLLVELHPLLVLSALLLQVLVFIQHPRRMIVL